MPQRIKYIFTYEKKGLMRFISHLDLVALFDRAIRRARFPVYYTEGFNPKIKISFSKAFPLGQEISSDVCTVSFFGECEPAEIKDTLNAFLPKGIRILHVEKQKEMAQAQ